MADRARAQLRQISADEFVSRLHLTASQPDAAFALFLGAGCSLSCQIPGAGTLATRWLKQLHQLRVPRARATPSTEWIQSIIPDWDPENPGGSYGRLIQELFLTPEERQREIDALCERKLPKWGYAVLAALMSDRSKFSGRFNVVLTTNFDDLLQDALIRFDRPKPLVIHHDALAGFIRPTRTRPLIVKLHGDHSLAPKNTVRETEELQEVTQQKVRSLLNDRGLIFIGYGGNDRSILQMLEGLPEEALPFGVFWVGHDEPRGILSQWLAQRDTVWVNYHDFDLLMDKIHQSFGEVTVPDRGHQKLIEQVLNNFETMEGEEQATVLGRAAVELLKRTDPVFFPNLAGYATFLDDYAKDYDTADLYYNAISMEYPRDAEVLGNYADFLERRKGDQARAKESYERAIEADPQDFRNLGNYAGLLEERKDYVNAREFFLRAATAADATNSYRDAAFLWFKEYSLDVTDERLTALQNLKKLIGNGVRVESRLKLNTQWAKKHRHPGKAWIDKLAEVLKGALEASAVDDWKEWQQA